MAERTPATNAFVSLGSTGLSRWGGAIEMEFHPRLRGDLAIETYIEMSENDHATNALLHAIKMLLRQADRKFEPASDESADKAAAEFCEECADDMSHSWDDMMTEIFTMFPFGWAWMDTTLKWRRGPDNKDAKYKSKYSDNRIGWRKIELRAQRSRLRWEIDDDGGILGMWQQDPQKIDGIFLPIERSLLFRTERVMNNPEGRSILRGAYRPWWYKKMGEEVEGIGLERDLTGLPAAYVPGRILATTASAAEVAQRTAIENMCRRVKVDEQGAVLFPSDEGYSFELIGSPGGKMIDTDKYLARKTREILQVVLGDWIAVGHEQTGSYALSSDKTNMFVLGIKAWLNAIADVFNSFAIPRLFRFNTFHGITDYPILEFGEIENIDSEQVARILTASGVAGLIPPGPDTIEQANALMRLIGMPEWAEHDVVEREQYNSFEGGTFNVPASQTSTSHLQTGDEESDAKDSE